jgi:hypothetical protein
LNRSDEVITKHSRGTGTPIPFEAQEAQSDWLLGQYDFVDAIQGVYVRPIIQLIDLELPFDDESRWHLRTDAVSWPKPESNKRLRILPTDVLFTDKDREDLGYSSRQQSKLTGESLYNIWREQIIQQLQPVPQIRSHRP